MLNLNHLYYFYVTVEERGVSRAAKKLKISQPALSNQLKTFSTSVGEKLFTYKGQTLTLTTRGRLVYLYAKQIFATYNELNKTLAQQEARSDARLQVGFSDEIDRTFGVNLICRLLTGNVKMQNVSLFLTTGNFHLLKQKSLSNELDLAIVTDPSEYTDFTVLSEHKTPVNLFAPSAMIDPIRSKLDKVSPRDHCARFDILQEAGIGLALPSPGLQLRAEIDRFFHAHNIIPRLQIEADFIFGMSQTLTSGVAMSILPTAYVNDALHRGSIETIGPAQGYWSHSIFVLVKDCKHLADLYEELSGVLKSCIAA